MQNIAMRSPHLHLRVHVLGLDLTKLQLVCSIASAFDEMLNKANEPPAYKYVCMSRVWALVHVLGLDLTKLQLVWSIASAFDEM